MASWVKSETGDSGFLVLERGELLHAAFERLASDLGVPALAVSGIGAVDEVELAYYRLDEKRYDTRRLDGLFELANLTGNVTDRDGQPFAHLHATLGAPDLSALAGHLVRARCAITVEALVTPLHAPLSRGAVDEFCGLRLIDA